MTTHIEISVGEEYRRIWDIKDAYKKRHVSFSAKACRAIIKQWEEEQRGSKITQYTGEQSRLPLLPPVYELPKLSDFDGLTYDELRSLLVTATEWKALAERAIAKAQALR